jgi:hypothetical protein
MSSSEDQHVDSPDSPDVSVEVVKVVKPVLKAGRVTRSKAAAAAAVVEPRTTRSKASRKPTGSTASSAIVLDETARTTKRLAPRVSDVLGGDSESDDERDAPDASVLIVNAPPLSPPPAARPKPIRSTRAASRAASRANSSQPPAAAARQSKRAEAEADDREGIESVLLPAPTVAAPATPATGIPKLQPASLAKTPQRLQWSRVELSSDEEEEEEYLPSASRASSGASVVDHGAQVAAVQEQLCHETAGSVHSDVYDDFDDDDGEDADATIPDGPASLPPTLDATVAQAFATDSEAESDTESDDFQSPVHHQRLPQPPRAAEDEPDTLPQSPVKPLDLGTPVAAERKAAKPTKAMDFIRNKQTETLSSPAQPRALAADQSGSATAMQLQGGFLSKMFSLWGNKPDGKHLPDPNCSADLPALVPISPKHASYSKDRWASTPAGSKAAPGSPFPTMDSVLTPVAPGRGSVDRSHSHEEFLKRMDDLCVSARISEDLEAAGALMIRDDDDLLQGATTQAADDFEALLEQRTAVMESPAPAQSPPPKAKPAMGFAPNAGRTASAAAPKHAAKTKPASALKKPTGALGTVALGHASNNAPAALMSPPPAKKPADKAAFLTPTGKHQIAEDCLRYARGLRDMLQMQTPTTKQGDSIDVCVSKDSDDEDDVFMMQAAPAWASKEQLFKEHKKQRFANPDLIFPPIDARTCDLEAMFRGKPRHRMAKPYRVRTSSGNWERDALTEEEIQRVTRAMSIITDS